MEKTNEIIDSLPTSAEQRKKRKFYLMIPVLILPFLAMAFWALGGGSSKQNRDLAANTKGINMALPSAQFKDPAKTDKMNIYQAAAKDSSKNNAGLSREFVQHMDFDPGKIDSAKTRNPADEQSDRITAKLAEINRQINRPAPSEPTQEPDPVAVKKLNRMMKTMNSSSAKDPEMEQINAMLNKIQAIQNPESVKPQSSSKKTEEMPFYAIPAIIDGKQKVVDGGTVRLRMTDTAKIKNLILPKGQLLFGACQLTNQRLLLHIENIRMNDQIVPVNLTVFSLDGLPGIPAPEAELGTAAGNGADNAIQSMQIMSMDASLGAQAAAGGINAAKGLFSKKVHKIKVKLKDQFPVLLKINKS